MQLSSGNMGVYPGKPTWVRRITAAGRGGLRQAWWIIGPNWVNRTCVNRIHDTNVYPSNKYLPECPTSIPFNANTS